MLLKVVMKRVDSIVLGFQTVLFGLISASIPN